MSNKKNYLETPFLQILCNLAHSHFNDIHYFKTGRLFWSFTRLFSYYFRIIKPLKNNQSVNRLFIESDIESFIIRQRIILNDIAYIIRQILPARLRGLRDLNNPTQFKKEMSYKDLKKFVEKSCDFQDLAKIFEINDKWISEIKQARDGIIHFESKAIIFLTEPEFTFTIINAAGEGEIGSAPDNRSVSKIPIFTFINNQLLSLWNFINEDLKNWLQDYIKDKKMNYREICQESEISCIGISLFKEVNKKNLLNKYKDNWGVIKK